MVVPAGTQHQFVNTGPTPLVSTPFSLRCSKKACSAADGMDVQILYTIYSPAEHNPQTVHKTKEEGDDEEENGKDEAPAWSQRAKADNEKDGIVKTSGKY